VEFLVVMVVSTQFVIACCDVPWSKLIGLVGGNECKWLQWEHCRILGFEILRSVTVKITNFEDVIPYSQVFTDVSGGRAA
jgi:hypothetical protein